MLGQAQSKSEKNGIHRLDRSQNLLSNVVHTKGARVPLIMTSHAKGSSQNNLDGLSTSVVSEQTTCNFSSQHHLNLPSQIGQSPARSIATYNNNSASSLSSKQRIRTGYVQHQTMNNFSARDEYFQVPSMIAMVTPQRDFLKKKQSEPSLVSKKASPSTAGIIPILQLHKIKGSPQQSSLSQLQLSSKRPDSFDDESLEMSLSLMPSSTKLSTMMNDQDGVTTMHEKALTEREKDKGRGSLSRIRFNSKHLVKVGSGLFGEMNERATTAGSGMKRLPQQQSSVPNNNAKSILKQPSPTRYTEISFAAATPAIEGQDSAEKMKKLIKKNTSRFKNVVDLTIFGERRVSEFSPQVRTAPTFTAGEKINRRGGLNWSEHAKKVGLAGVQEVSDAGAATSPQQDWRYLSPNSKKKTSSFKGFFNDNYVAETNNMEVSQLLTMPIQMEYKDVQDEPVGSAGVNLTLNTIMNSFNATKQASGGRKVSIALDTVRRVAKTAGAMSQRNSYFPSQPAIVPPSEKTIKQRVGGTNILIAQEENALEKSTRIISEQPARLESQPSPKLFISETSGVSNSSMKESTILSQLIELKSNHRIGQKKGLSKYAPSTAPTIAKRKLSTRSDDAKNSNDKKQEKEVVNGVMRRIKEEKPNHPLSSSKFKETLAFWSKLKKQTYTIENEDEEGAKVKTMLDLKRSQSYRMKKNGFDQKAIQFLVQLVDTISELTENVSYDERAYANVNAQLSEMISSVRAFQSISQFFVVRLLTLSGKFSFKCGNMYNAMKMFLSAKKLAHKTQDFKRKLRLHRYIGLCFKLLKDFTNAKSQFIKMLKLAWVTDNKDAELKAYDELGIIFYYGCELLISQRLHMRLCQNITEHPKSKIRTTVVDNFNKVLRDEEEKNLMGIDSPIRMGRVTLDPATLNKDEKTNSKKKKKQNRGFAAVAAAAASGARQSLTASSQPMEMSILEFAKQKPKSSQNNGAGGNGSAGSGANGEGGATVVEKETTIGGIDVEFSDSSEEEADFFVRQFAQQDILREEKAEKDRKEEERSEKTLKNVRFKYSKIAQEQENNRNDVMMYNKIKQSERLQNISNSMTGGNQVANPQIFLTHLSRNRRENDFKEDLFKEHQYFHLKEYRSQLFCESTDLQQDTMTSIELNKGDSNVQQKQSSKHLSIKSSAHTSGSLKDSSKASLDISNVAPKMANKFPVAPSAYKKLVDDLGKVKQQIVLLLNNIEKFEANFLNPTTIKRKNALFFV